MRFLNHGLGAIAKVNSVLWRYRINFIPLNVLLIFALGLINVDLWCAAIDAVRNSETPLEISLEQIWTNHQIIQNYVRVSGVAVPIAVYEYGAKGNNETITRVDKSWFPLVDLENTRALLIQRAGTAPQGEPHLAAITGMLRPVDYKVRNRLAANGDQIEGVPIETRYMLVEDDHPGNPWASCLGAIFVFLIFGCVGIVSLKRNIVFQSSSRIIKSLAKIDQAASLHVRATGRFVLDAQTSQRFIEAPAMLTVVNGFPVVVSKIDASRRFMGMTTRERAGVWSMAFQPGTARDVEFGFLFFGLSRLPAFKVRYTDPADHAYRSAVISVAETNRLEVAAAIVMQAG
jgi:hypothetical protein